MELLSSATSSSRLSLQYKAVIGTCAVCCLILTSDKIYCLPPICPVVLLTERSSTQKRKQRTHPARRREWKSHGNQFRPRNFHFLIPNKWKSGEVLSLIYDFRASPKEPIYKNIILTLDAFTFFRTWYPCGSPKKKGGLTLGAPRADEKGRSFSLASTIWFPPIRQPHLLFRMNIIPQVGVLV